MVNKMTYPVVFYDGAKAVSAYNLDDMRGWTILSGDDTQTKDDAYFQRVPWLFRGVKDRANNVSKMPFAIVRGETDWDTSQGYQNKLECLPNPQRILRQVEQSLTMTGRAYLFLETNNAGYVKNIKYCKPTSIDEVYDNNTGEVTGYKRRLKGRTFDVKLENIVAVYDPDYATEAGPGNSSAAKAALTAAGVLYNADRFISQYFERGAIKATILSTGPQTGAGEADRLQHWWDDVVAGIKNAWSAIVLRSDAVKPVVIGEGLESMTNETLTSERRQDIATALGLPESRLWSAAANYATAEQDTRNYYDSTIIPECELIAEALNSQLFTKAHKLDGYRLEFRPETLEMYQDDNQAQSQAASAFIDFLTKCPTAEIALETCAMMGFELSDAMTAAIEQWFADKQAKAEEIQQSIAQAQAEPPAQDEDAQDDQGQEDDGEPEGETPDQQPNPFEMRAALAAWKRKAIHAIERGEAAAVEFVTTAIPAKLREAVAYELEACATVEEVKRAFDALTAPQPVDMSELRRANDLLEKAMANG